MASIAGLVKALRACAMLRDKQDRRNEAVAYLGRAYQCVYNAHGNMVLYFVFFFLFIFIWREISLTSCILLLVI